MVPSSTTTTVFNKVFSYTGESLSTPLVLSMFIIGVISILLFAIVAPIILLVYIYRPQVSVCQYRPVSFIVCLVCCRNIFIQQMLSLSVSRTRDVTFGMECGTFGDVYLSQLLIFSSLSRQYQSQWYVQIRVLGSCLVLIFRQCSDPLALVLCLNLFQYNYTQ